MKKVKVAMYGTGAAHAIGALGTLRELNEYFDFIGVCEPDEKLKRMAEDMECYKGVHWLTEEEMLKIPDLDAIVVESEEVNLTKSAIAMARRDLHIYMDKPGGESLEDFDELIQIMKSTGKVFYTGYMYRHNPSVIYAKKLIEDGVLGEITSIETQMSIRFDSTASLLKFKGGITYFLGCHLIDLIYSILGEPNKIIPHSASTKADLNDSLDYGFTVFEYEKGASFIKTNATEINGFDRRQIVITGTKGTVEIRPVELFDKVNTLYLTSEMKISVLDGNNIAEEVIKFPKYKRYDDMFIDFARCVVGEKTNNYSYDYERGLHRLIMKSF